MTDATDKFPAAAFALLFFTGCLLFAGPVYGQVPPDSVRQAAWQQFQAENGAGWVVHWNEKTGTPRAILSGETRPYTGPPAQAARAFLSEHRRLFGVAPGLSNLKLGGVRTYGQVRHVRFQQTYRGLPVYEADYLVHFGSEGRVIMANGTFYPDVEVPTTPQLSAAAARQVALADLSGKVARGEITSKLVIYPQAEVFYLAWRLTVPTLPFGGREYFVDARSGAILQKQNLLMDVAAGRHLSASVADAHRFVDAGEYALAAVGARTPSAVIGEGNVYPTHPDLSNVTSKNLYRLNGSGYLRGTYAYVLNDETSEAYSANNDFTFGTGNIHFDEVNLYYHVDKFRSQFINDLIDANHPLGFTQIAAHAHSHFEQDCQTDLDPEPETCDFENNAWFDRTDQEIYFGDGDNSSNNDFAKEDKIIYHEYFHAVVYDINSGIESTCEEEGSISEGIADYFAGAHTGRPVIADYVLPADDPRIRDMTDPALASYAEYQDRHEAGNCLDDNDYNGDKGVPAHMGGEFFSAVLWDLRANLSDVMSDGDIDRLVFGALYYLSSGPDFLEFRAALITEDEAVYGGAHEHRISNVFHERGIGWCLPLEIDISGPTGEVQSNTSVSYEAIHSCGKAPYTIRWYDESATPIDEPPEYNSGLQDIYTKTTGGADDDFYIQVTIEDSRGVLKESPVYFVDVVAGDDGSGGGGGGGDCPPGELCTASAEQQALTTGRPLPEEFSLQGNAPNPFSDRTEIRFALPEAARVTLVVYDVQGRVVMRLVNRTLEAGYHTAPVDASDLASGVYLYRLTAGDTFADAGRMVVVK